LESETSMSKNTEQQLVHMKKFKHEKSDLSVSSFSNLARELK